MPGTITAESEPTATLRRPLTCRICGERCRRLAVITLDRVTLPAPLCHACFLQLTSPVESVSVVGM